MVEFSPSIHEAPGSIPQHQAGGWAGVGGKGCVDLKRAEVESVVYQLISHQALPHVNYTQRKNLREEIKAKSLILSCFLFRLCHLLCIVNGDGN